MNALEQAIHHALESEGENQKANKAYLEFIKANFVIPVEKNTQTSEPQVLYIEEQGHPFLPVFTSMSYLQAWANDVQHDINMLTLSGVDLLKGIGDQTTVCLNIGSEIYKEFNPAEIARMRSMVLKFFNTP